MPGAAIYCRISRDRVGAGLGVERQEQDCRALAERLNLPVSAVLVDNDLSAYTSRKPRPAYQRVLDGLKAGTYDTVIAWHPDRLHRSPLELESFIDVVEAARARVLTVQGGDYDLTTATGRMNARLIGVVARHESEHKSERIKRKHLELAEKGLPSGGLRAYGYEPDGMTVREDEAVIVREMCSRFLAGDSIHSIAVDLNRRGVPTVTGAPWANQHVRQTISRGRNVGLRMRHDKVFGDAAWPPIVSRDVWAACCARLNDPGRRTSFSNARVHLLTGLMVCGRCGSRMRGTTRSSGQLIYKCPNACLSRDMAPVDRMISAAVVTLLAKTSARKFVQRESGRRNYTGEMTVLRSRMKDAAKLYARGAIDDGTLEEIKRDIDTQLEEINEAAATEQPTELVGLPGTTDEVEERWANLSLERKRAVIARLLVITVLPTRKGSRFDPSSVRLQPR